MKKKGGWWGGGWGNDPKKKVAGGKGERETQNFVYLPLLFVPRGKPEQS